jgi:protein-tyrosine phosphatase
MNSDYNIIVENLLLGNKKSSETYGDRMYFVVNCTKDIKLPTNCKESVRIPIDDLPSEADKLLYYMLRTNILQKIHLNITNKKPVLVHCFAGMQRSCAVVACYLISYYNVTPLMAIKYIKQRRRVAFFGGVNFIKTLEMFYSMKK